jgi:hypothetical protein
MINKMSLRINEVIEYDVDDNIEKELNNFYNKIRGIRFEEINKFENWLNVYKILNYDIFKNLVIRNIYKFNEKSAVIELKFNGKIEYDLLSFNDDDLTVTVINVKDDAVKRNVIRRFLLPQDAEEALIYATSPISYKDVEAVGVTLNEIKTNSKSYIIVDNLAKELGLKRKYKKSENKINENKKDEKNDKVNKNELIALFEKMKDDTEEDNCDGEEIIRLIRNDEIEKAIKLMKEKLFKNIKNKEVKKLLINRFIQAALIKL